MLVFALTSIEKGNVYPWPWYNVREKNMMMPHRATFAHHTGKLLPYGTAKGSSIRQKYCSGGKRNYFLRFGKMKNQGLIHSAFGHSGLESIKGY